MELRGGLVLLFATMHLGICQENYGMFATDAGGYIYAFNQDMSYVIYNIGVQVIGIAVDPYSRDHDQNIVFSTLEQTGSPLRSLDIEALQMRVLFNAHAFGAYIDRIAIEHNTKHVYFSAVGQPGSSFIGLFTPDGHFRRLVTDLHTPRAIKLDTRSRRLYYTDHGGEEPHIGCANFDGTSSEKLVTTDIGWPNGLDIDFNSNKLLWTDGLLSKIESYDLSTGERSIVMRFDGLQLMDILLDGDAYFFLAWGYNYIFKASLISHEITDYHQVNGSLRLDALAVYSPYTHQRPAFTDCDDRDGLGDCSDICILSEEGHVCSCDEGYKLLENEKTCENAELCPRLMSPAGIADSSCYRHQQDTCQQVCFAGYSGTGEASFCENSTWHDSNDCEIDENWHSEGEGDNYRLFVTDKQGLIYGLNPDGRVIETVGAVDTAENTRLAQAIGLGVDHHTTDFSTSFVYSTFETSGFYMYRKQLNIPEADLVLNTTKFGAYIDRFAIEPRSKNIYFTAVVQGDAGKSFISVLSPRGDHVPLFGGLNEPRDIILDTRYSLLFWTDHSQIYPYIGWAYMDGSGASYLITQEIYPIKWPNGLALDQAANLLFWTDGDTETINSYDLFEGTIQTIMSVPHSHLMDIQIDGHYFLYLDWQNVGVITKVNMNDLNDMTTFRISGAERLDAMALYSGNTQSLDGDVKCADRNGRGDCSDVCLPNDNGYVCACDHQVDFTDEDQKTCANAQLCPKTIRNVILSDSCRRHDLEVCDFYCAAGFSSVSTKIKCENKVWNLADPCQPDCRQLDPPVNGMIESSHGNSYQSVATFKCKTGYNLEGPTTRMCESGGVWSNRNPVCHMIECSETLDLPNGIVTLSNNQWYGSKATFECNIGHQISEEVVRTCMETGKWSHSSPTCARIECSETLDLLNGIVTLSDNQWYGSEATFECNTGHQISEEVVRTCMETGKWSQRSPTCARMETTTTSKATTTNQQTTISAGSSSASSASPTTSEPPTECRPLTKPENGTMVLSNGVSFGSVASFSCSVGYKLLGPSNLTCYTDGSWTSDAPKCQRIECSKIVHPDYATVTYSDELFYNTKVQFDCCHDCERKGPRRIWCQANGTWTKDPPTCIPPETMTTSKATTTNQPTILSPTTTTVSEGSASASSELSTTSGPLTECRPLTKPENGTMVLSNGVSFGSVASFGCSVGYKLQGSNSLTCQTNGSWTNDAPKCQRIECSKIVHPDYATVTYSDELFYNTKVQFDCCHDCERKGPRRIWCQANGTWTKDPPTCIPPETTTASISTSNTSTASQPTSSTPTATTAAASSTSSGPPTECRALSKPENGTMNQSSGVSFGSIVEFSCSVGFKLQGPSTLTCYTNGSWSNDVPKCQRIECPKVVHPENANVTYSDGLFYDSKVQFDCCIDCERKGPRRIWCQANGTWTKEPPTCTPPETTTASISTSDTSTASLRTSSTPTAKTTAASSTSSEPPTGCRALSKPENGTMNQSSGVSFGSVVEFNCSVGFKLQGPSTLTCLTNGYWSNDVPKCQRIECPKVVHPENANVTYSDGLFYNSKVQFDCCIDCERTGPRRIWCQANGTWTKEPPTCIPPEQPSTSSSKSPTVTASTMSPTKAPTVTQNPNPDQGEGAGGIIKPGIPLTALAMLFVLYI